jgi:hypothetical protein
MSAMQLGDAQPQQQQQLFSFLFFSDQTYKSRIFLFLQLFFAVLYIYAVRVKLFLRLLTGLMCYARAISFIFALPPIFSSSLCSWNRHGWNRRVVDISFVSQSYSITHTKRGKKKKRLKFIYFAFFSAWRIIAMCCDVIGPWLPIALLRRRTNDGIISTVQMTSDSAHWWDRTG